MSKVYVVTAGEYSDYHICAVSLDRETAENLAKLYTTSYEAAEVEEYDTEDYKNPTYLIPVYTIRIVNDEIIANHFLKYETERKPQKCELEYDEYYGGWTFLAEICAESQELATKIAIDTYAMLKAQQLGL